jgi:hypothetical protein
MRCNRTSILKLYMKILIESWNYSVEISSVSLIKNGSTVYKAKSFSVLRAALN